MKRNTTPRFLVLFYADMDSGQLDTVQMESQPRLNETCPDNPDFVPLEWYNVAIASIFIVVNGEKNAQRSTLV